MFPDPKTLMLALALSLGVSCVSNVTLWIQHRQETAPKYWAWASGGISAGVALQVGRGIIPDFISIVVSNGLTLTGFMFFYVGSAYFVGRKPNIKISIVLLFIFISPLFYLYISPDYFVERTVLVFVCISAFSFMTAELYFFQKKRTAGQVLVGSSFAGTAIAYSGLPFWLLFGIDYENDTQSIILFRSVLHYMGIFGISMIAVGFVIIVAERLRQSVQDKLNEQIELREREAVRMREERSFYAMISHEFRTPLSTISTANEIIALNLAEGDTETAEEVERIRRSASQIVTMIDNLITDNFMEINRDIVPEPLDLRTLLGSVCATRGVRMQLDEAGPVSVVGEPNLLPIVFNNLVDNALKYGKTVQGVLISLTRPSQDRIRVTVRDDGDGVPEAQKALIFEKYYRMAKDRRVQGNGIGLYLAKRILDAHGATIECQKTQDGNTFMVEFPSL
jgi:signal transduction histidine kinase